VNDSLQAADTVTIAAGSRDRDTVLSEFYNFYFANIE